MQNVQMAEGAGTESSEEGSRVDDLVRNRLVRNDSNKPLQLDIHTEAELDLRRLAQGNQSAAFYPFPVESHPDQ